MLKLVAICVVFGLVGLGMQCFFTAREKHLRGYSSIWYVPLYMLPPLIFQYHWWPFSGQALFQRLFMWPWYSRGLIYVAGIYAAEFAWMLVLRCILGSSPSEKEYRASGRSILGLVRWDFFLFWFAAGLMMEGVFRLFQGLPPF